VGRPAVARLPGAGRGGPGGPGRLRQRPAPGPAGGHRPAPDHPARPRTPLASGEGWPALRCGQARQYAVTVATFPTPRFRHPAAVSCWTACMVVHGGVLFAQTTARDTPRTDP